MTGRNAGPVEGVWASGGPAFSQEPQKCIAVLGVVIPATATASLQTSVMLRPQGQEAWADDPGGHMHLSQAGTHLEL